MLFESRGGPRYCWCMVWRDKPPGAALWKGRERQQKMKSALYSRVVDGIPVGILAYGDGVPAGWCSVAPRSTHRKLGGPVSPGGDDSQVWSVTCFFVQRQFRGNGLFGRLLKAAIAEARRKGANVIEAYPVERNSPSYRFMGYVDSFREEGFAHVGRAGTRRHVMRLLIAQSDSGSAVPKI